jgi:signal peptidase I
MDNAIVSRTERRIIERKQRKEAKKKASSKHRQSTSTPSSPAIATLKNPRGKLLSVLNSSPHLRSFSQSFIPRIPGRIERFQKEHWIALAYRLPAFVTLCYLMTDEDFSPYIIKCSLGPSMLPTIQFVGDIWLVETGAWTRAWAKLRHRDEFSDLTSSYQVGDLLLWKESASGRLSCKRLIGREGDTIRRYGQYAASLYRTRPDLGIKWPSDAADRGLHDTMDIALRMGSGVDVAGSDISWQTMVVPANFLWLEGDCPLFSVDSRQYGPIPASSVTGRLVFRLWPWSRPEIARDPEYSYLSSCWISRKRPEPFATAEAYLGKKFGFYRVSSSAHNAASTSV